MEEFKTVVKSPDVAEGLHNFREFSQSPFTTTKCLDEAM